jgi:hypothetical protein
MRPTLALPVLLLLAGVAPAADEPVRVTVVAVLATDKDKEVHAQLKELAKEVQKTEPTLTGFDLGHSSAKSIAVGDKATFTLVDKKTMDVTVNQPKDGENRVSLTINPPGLGEVTYSCTCTKFFPMMTPYRTADGKVLIVAVMAKPCTGGKKK